MEELNEISLRERIRLNLVSYMESVNINQVQLAEKLGISKGTVNNWARGNNSPDVDMVPKICKVLGISILDLYSPTRFEANEYKISKKAPSLSDETMKLATDYDDLDGHGKRVVRVVVDEEKARCKEERDKQASILREQRQKMEAGQMLDVEIVYFTVPWFFQPMGAGPGETAGSEPPEDLRLIKAPPRGTSFVARVHGVSMEPTYQDGDLVFVHSAEEIPVGSIGAFFMDGQQWIKELGDGELISHNPDPEYAPRPFTEDIKCQGLVLGVCDESYFE